MLKYFLLILILSASVFAGKIDKNLSRFISENPGQKVKVWIFFTDKGPRDVLSFSREYNRISETALKRRAKMDNDVIQYTDYPVYKPYLQQLRDYAEIRKESRWLNAVSALVNQADIERINDFIFVDEIRLMAIYKKRLPKQNSFDLTKTFSTPEDSQFYGPSLRQLEQIHVTELHHRGYNGKGVTIAMLDDGFNQYDQHIVFDSLKVLAAYDFVNDDADVTDRDSLPRQGWHGTQTLSVIGGYTPGQLIGTAYNADFLLAKTEIDKDELQQEEDNWVAGLEWAEARGADIVSSSLGYYDWYTWEDMDGKTAVTTLATNIAETKGLVVVVSAGNEGRTVAPNTLGAPADGVFVITVGGVNIYGDYYASSSYGPTADGRIKPDICAMGTGVYRASDSNIESFLVGSGTSFSAPLTAGGIALLLEAFPDLTPRDIRDALKKTASQASAPDNYLGYGIVNFNAAYEYISGGSQPNQPVTDTPINSPNPFTIYTRIEYSVKVPSIVSVTIYDVSGRQVISFPAKTINENYYEIVLGNQLGANGIYFYTVRGRELESGKRISKHGKLLYFK
jgi:serine protease AprX